MYYIMLRDHTYIAARLTEEASENDELPFSIRQFDFDDEAVWPDQRLVSELSRVSQGKDYDPYAMCAIDMEQSRRRGQEYFRTFGDRDALMDFLMGEDNEENRNDESEKEHARIFHNSDLSEDDVAIIRRLAAVFREEVDMQKGHGEYGVIEDSSSEFNGKFLDILMREAEIQAQLLHSTFANRVIPDRSASYSGNVWIRVDELKTLASHLMFMYGEDRLEAEAFGEKTDEDFFFAGMSCYRSAVSLEESLQEENGEDDEYLFPRDMDLNELASLAETYTEHLEKADLNDPMMEVMRESTELFLKEKGYDCNTLTGLKAAQKWLESAKIQEVFYNDEDPVDNDLDWFIGEARLTAMIRIVNAMIEKKLGQGNGME